MSADDLIAAIERLATRDYHSEFYKRNLPDIQRQSEHDQKRIDIAHRIRGTRFLIEEEDAFIRSQFLLLRNTACRMD